MLDEQDRNIKPAADIAYRGHQLMGFGRVHTRGRLIQQQQLRLGCQRTRNLQLALLTVGQIARFALRQIIQSDHLEQLVRPLIHFCFFLPISGKAQDGFHHIVMDRLIHGDFDIVNDRNILKQTNILEGTGNAHAGRLIGLFADDGAAFQLDGAGRGLINIGEHVEHCRLARAVRADQSDDLALVDRKINALNCFQTAEGNAEVFHFQNLGHAFSPPFLPSRCLGFQPSMRVSENS